MTLADAATTATDTVLDRTIAPGYSRLGYRIRRAGWPDDDPRPAALATKTVLVTGASAGLGLAASREAARLGARVLALARNRERGERAVDEVRRSVPGADIALELCDVSDLAEAKEFGGELSRRVDALDAIVHNAGVMPPKRAENPQGHELSFATHVLGPMVLTDALRPALGASGDARVIMVSSGGMYAQRLPVDDPEYREGTYKPATAYARSKRIQVALTPMLNRRWSVTGARTYAMHPGWADTPGVAESLPTFRKLTGPLLRSPEQGADTMVWLAATEPAPPGGGFWHDRRPRPAHYLPGRGESSADLERMWKYCCDAAGIST